MCTAVCPLRNTDACAGALLLSPSTTTARYVCGTAAPLLTVQRAGFRAIILLSAMFAMSVWLKRFKCVLPLCVWTEADAWRLRRLLTGGPRLCVRVTGCSARHGLTLAARKIVYDPPKSGHH